MFFAILGVVFTILGTFRHPKHICIFFQFLYISRYLPNCKQLTFHFNFNCQYWCQAPSLWWRRRTSRLRPSTRSAMCRCRLSPSRGTAPRAPPTMSPVPARSCPCSRPCSQSVCRVVRLAAHPTSPHAHRCACTCQPGGHHRYGSTHAG